MVARSRLAKVVNEGPPRKQTFTRSSLTFNDSMTKMLIARSRLAKRVMDDPRRDLNAECGYPENSELTPETYREWYEREGLAQRVVSAIADECWLENPDLCENEEEKETTFELAWRDLNFQIPIWHYLHRADVLSGIGTFGVIFLGLD